MAAVTDDTTKSKDANNMNDDGNNDAKSTSVDAILKRRCIDYPVHKQQMIEDLRRYLEVEFGIRKPMLGRKICFLLLIVTEIVMHVFNILVYGWLFYVSNPFYYKTTRDTGDLGTHDFIKFDTWEEESIAHAMTFSVIFTYILPQSIILPMFLEEHNLSKKAADLCLKMLAIIIFIAFQILHFPFTYTYSGESIHSACGYIANIFFCIVVIHKLAQAICHWFRYRKGKFRIIDDFLSRPFVQDTVTLGFIFFMSAAVISGLCSYVWTLNTGLSLLFLLEDVYPSDISVLRGDNSTYAQVAAGCFVCLTLLLTLCYTFHHYLKFHTGNMTKETFKKNFLQFDLNYRQKSWGEVFEESLIPRRRV